MTAVRFMRAWGLSLCFYYKHKNYRCCLMTQLKFHPQYVDPFHFSFIPTNSSSPLLIATNPHLHKHFKRSHRCCTGPGQKQSEQECFCLLCWQPGHMLFTWESPAYAHIQPTNAHTEKTACTLLTLPTHESLIPPPLPLIWPTDGERCSLHYTQPYTHTNTHLGHQEPVLENCNWGKKIKSEAVSGKDD